MCLKRLYQQDLQDQCYLQGLFQVLGLARLLYLLQIDFDIY